MEDKGMVRGCVNDERVKERGKEREGGGHGERGRAS